MGTLSGHDESDRPVPAAEVEQFPFQWRGRRRVEKQRGGRVEATVAKDTRVGVEGERDGADRHIDSTGIARYIGILVEVVRHCFGSLPPVGLEIRTFGDPVLKSQAAPVVDVDGRAIRLVEQMFDTLDHSDGGIALAAPQIGVQKQVVVWDLDGDRRAIFNPEIVESSGEWVYDEGCLSIPGLYVELVRPRTVLLRGVDVNGEIIEYEADDLEARMYQHELDHLNGVLMFDRMGDEQRREAMAEYRRITSGEADDVPRPRRLRFR